MHRIIQVISNLLSNSFKFTQEGTILVTTRKYNTNSRNQVIVSVKDTGTWNRILKSYQDYLQNLLQNQIEEEELDLDYTSQRILLKHMGVKIWAENNKDSKGATFSFSLPISG